MALSFVVQSAEAAETPKSLYVIASVNRGPTPVNIYNVQAEGKLGFLVTSEAPCYGRGAVGLAIDTASATLFMTYEQSNTIIILNATSLCNIGMTTAEGATSLSGIAVDQDRQKVYTADQNTQKLFVFSWSAASRSLTLDSTQTLPSLYQAQGLALDEQNDWLYVGDATTKIKVFSTSDWSNIANRTVSQRAQSVAIDSSRSLLYSGNSLSDYGSLGLLCKLDLNSNNEVTLNIRGVAGGATDDNVVGLAVDPETGSLYTAVGNRGPGGSDRLLVFSSDLTLLESTTDIGDPTGIAVPKELVAYNPLDLSKKGNAEAVLPGDTINYTISLDNEANNFAIHNAIVTDLLPQETTFVSASGGGIYNSTSHTVRWIFSLLPAGAPRQSLVLTVMVNPCSLPGTLDNVVTVTSCETRPLFTKHETTTILPVIPEFSYGIIAGALVCSLGFGALLFGRKKAMQEKSFPNENTLPHL